MANDLDGVDGERSVHECPDYIVDFFDSEKACQRFPDLRAKFQSMPAMSQINDVFSFLAMEFADIYTQIEDPGKVGFRILRNKNYQRIFYEKLIDVFEKKVEPRIAIIRKSIKEMGLSEKQFAPGWEDRLRYDVAWAFLIHFRQKRHESDYDPKTGEPTSEQLDYIRHPLRVALSETRPVSVGLIDETTVELGVLHDVIEDFNKGFFGEKGINLPESALAFLKDAFLAEIDKNQPPSLSERGDKKSRLIGIVSKDDDPNKTREQHLIELLRKITHIPNLPDGRVPENRIELFLNNLKCFVVKVLDRLDNEQTSHYLKVKKPVVFEAMMNETSYIFYVCAILFGMTSAADWITDFVELIDKGEWRPFFNLRKEAVKTYDSEAALIQFFQSEMEKRAGTTGLHPVYGKDYAIISRPRALRYRKDSLKRKTRRSTRDSVSISGAKAMSHPFQHNIIFVPLASNPSINETIADCAREIFASCFRPLEIDAYEKDRNTPFGSMFEYVTDRRVVKDAGRPSFGDVVYTVFNGPEDMRKRFYGLVHAAIIDRDEISTSYMVGAFESIADHVAQLQTNLSCLNSIDMAPSVLTARTKGLAVDTIDARTDDNLPKMPAIIDPEIIEELKKVIEFNVYALFPRVINAKIKITRIKDGKAVAVNDFDEINLPLGSNVAYALLHTLPTSLCYKVTGCYIGSALSDIGHVIRSGDCVDIYVDEDAYPDRNTQLRQIEIARISLNNYILPLIAKCYGLDLSRANSALKA